MRRPLDARAKRTLVVLGLSLPLLACDRTDEPDVERQRGTTAPSASVTPFRPAPRPVPPLAASAETAARALPTASRDPDWGLDPADPAKDYVTRYLKATKRYGDQASCVTVRPSTFAQGKAVVEARNDASGPCGKADELRDRFFVTIATDRMSLDGSLHGSKLQSWPDGSEPDGPAAKVTDIQDLRAWKAGLRDAFHALQLAPLRVQLYGRGTYPVISIAGWHGPVLRTMSPAELEAPARALCAANDGEPIGIFGGVDRATLLRISCPGSARFETL